MLQFGGGRLLAELHRNSLYPMMGKDTWVAGVDHGEAPGPKPVRLGRRLAPPPAIRILAALEWWSSARSLEIVGVTGTFLKAAGTG